MVEPYPSEKWWSEFVSWDDDIPNRWKVVIQPCSSHQQPVINNTWRCILHLIQQKLTTSVICPWFKDRIFWRHRRHRMTRVLVVAIQIPHQTQGEFKHRHDGKLVLQFPETSSKSTQIHSDPIDIIDNRLAEHFCWPQVNHFFQVKRPALICSLGCGAGHSFQHLSKSMEVKASFFASQTKFNSKHV